MNNGNGGIYLAPTPAQQMVKATNSRERVIWLMEYMQKLDMDGIAIKLQELPDQIAKAQIHRIRLQLAVDDAKENVEIANLDLREQAREKARGPRGGIDEDAFKDELRKAQVSSREYKAATKALQVAEGVVKMHDAEIKRLEQSYQGLMKVSEQATARINAVSR